MNILIDGKPVEVESVSIVTKAKPRATPPKDDTPPVRTTKAPVKEPVPKAPTGGRGKATTNLGALKTSVSNERLNLRLNATAAVQFSIPKGGRIPVLTFNVAPQGAGQSGYEVWLSEAPRGNPIEGVITTATKSRGGQFAFRVSVKGRQPRKLGLWIEEGKQYYLNIKLTSGTSSQPIVLRAVGAF